jgi:hypothetical protein
MPSPALGVPPPDIPPARLFRSLLVRPRAVLCISHRINGAEHIPLSVQALRGSEVASVYDTIPPGLDDAARRSHVTLGLVAASLCTPDGMAFNSAREVASLYGPEVMALGTAVLRALAIVSPSYLTSDAQAWDAKLREGAQDPTNIHQAVLMADSADVAVGWSGTVRTPRPDRYFGLPPCQLTDGQLMAYRAGYDAVEAIRGDANG